MFNVTAGNTVERDFRPNYYVALCESSQDNLVRSSDIRPINLGQKIGGSTVDRGFTKFQGNPTDDTNNPSTISVSNIGGELLSIALMDGSKNPMVIREGVKGNETAAFVPKLVLYAYVSRDFVDGQIVRSEIRGNPATFDVSKAANGVTFTLSGDKTLDISVVPV